jgi:hypothetical protein
MSQEKLVIKKLKCGGWAMYSEDAKTKTQIQTGYIGSNLKPEAWVPAGTIIQDK